MKTKLMIKDNIQYLIIEYEGNDKKIIGNKLKELGLNRAKTENGFNLGEHLNYYRETANELREYLLMETQKERGIGGIEFFDNINAPVFNENRINLAIFRVIPPRNSVKIKLTTYINIEQLQTLAKVLKAVYKAIFQILTEKVEIGIKLIK